MSHAEVNKRIGFAVLDIKNADNYCELGKLLKASLQHQWTSEITDDRERSIAQERLMKELFSDPGAPFKNLSTVNLFSRNMFIAYVMADHQYNFDRIGDMPQPTCKKHGKWSIDKLARWCRTAVVDDPILLLRLLGAILDGNIHFTEAAIKRKCDDLIEEYEVTDKPVETPPMHLLPPPGPSTGSSPALSLSSTPVEAAIEAAAEPPPDQLIPPSTEPCIIPAEDDDNNTDVRYCVESCPCPADGESYWMMQCSHCEKWFHNDCVGLSNGWEKHMKSFCCPPCRKPLPGRKTGKRILYHAGVCNYCDSTTKGGMVECEGCGLSFHGRCRTEPWSKEYIKNINVYYCESCTASTKLYLWRTKLRINTCEQCDGPCTNPFPKFVCLECDPPTSPDEKEKVEELVQELVEEKCELCRRKTDCVPLFVCHSLECDLGFATTVHVFDVMRIRRKHDVMEEKALNEEKQIQELSKLIAPEDSNLQPKVLRKKYFQNYSQSVQEEAITFWKEQRYDKLVASTLITDSIQDIHNKMQQQHPTEKFTLKEAKWAEKWRKKFPKKKQYSKIKDVKLVERDTQYTAEVERDNYIEGLMAKITPADMKLSEADHAKKLEVSVEDVCDARMDFQVHLDVFSENEDANDDIWGLSFLYGQGSGASTPGLQSAAAPEGRPMKRIPKKKDNIIRTKKRRISSVTDVVSCNYVPPSEQCSGPVAMAAKQARNTVDDVMRDLEMSC